VSAGRESNLAGSIQAVVQRARHISRVHYHDAIGSTNTEALDLARAGAPHGTLVIADRQTAGRGRMGRHWESPPGVGLWFSWILRPELPLASGFLLTVAGALAVVETTGRLAGRLAQVRWPNDVMIGEKKVAGILAEARGDANRLEAVVLGIGVNVNQLEADFPDELGGIATSLALSSGHSFDRSLVFAGIVESFEFLYDRMIRDGAQQLLEEWRRSMSLIGHPVTLTLADGVLTGRAVALADDGALIIEDAMGTRRSFHAGDVRRIRESS